MAKKTFTQTEVNELAEEYMECKRQSDMWNDRLKKSKEKLEEVVASRNADEITTRMHYIKRIVCQNHTVDSTRLKDELPDIYVEYQKPYESHRWNVR